MPESLVRVQQLTGKTLIFYPADLCNKDSLREVFSKVSSVTFMDIFCEIGWSKNDYSTESIVWSILLP